MEVRRLRVGEGTRLRELRLRALADAPAAFAATAAEDAARPAGDWEALAGGPGVLFVAEDGGDWLGMAGAQLGEDGTAAILWGMWVAPEARGRGAGRRLAEAVIAWAGIRGLARVRLSAGDAAPAARALYDGLGFEPTGEARPLESHPSILAPELSLPLGPPDRTIRTGRLLLRPFAGDDLAAIHAMRSRDDVVRFLYDEPSTLADDCERLARRIHNVRFAVTGDGIALAVVHDGTVVGDCSLTLHSAEHHQGEVGFIVHPDHQGRGYATEAARAMLELGFGGFGLHRIAGRAEARNAPSGRVLERLGMRREAHLVENELVKGEWQSELVYAILAREWRQSQSRRRK